MTGGWEKKLKRQLHTKKMPLGIEKRTMKLLIEQVYDLFEIHKHNPKTKGCTCGWVKDGRKNSVDAHLEHVYKVLEKRITGGRND